MNSDIWYPSNGILCKRRHVIHIFAKAHRTAQHSKAPSAWWLFLKEVSLGAAGPEDMAMTSRGSWSR